MPYLSRFAELVVKWVISDERGSTTIFGIFVVQQKIAVSTIFMRINRNYSFQSIPNVACIRIHYFKLDRLGLQIYLDINVQVLISLRNEQSSEVVICHMIGQEFIVIVVISKIGRNNCIQREALDSLY